MILHITTSKEWADALKKGEYKATSLETDGFIHCSTLRQTLDTANVFFKGQKNLVLLCIDVERLDAEIKYEEPAGGKEHDPALGNLFPHVYGPINLLAVIKVLDFPPKDDGYFELPMELSV